MSTTLIPADSSWKGRNLVHTMLCPGRYFTTHDVIAVVAIFIAKLDMKPTDGDWELPTTANINVAAVAIEPNNDIQVEIKALQGFEDVKWSISLDDSEKSFAMVTEDNEGREVIVLG